jgi:prepilin-type N-terminal cleavage/methylation domain-containing protein/prepilin-type processing-associated H-X9-DG protein
MVGRATNYLNCRTAKPGFSLVEVLIVVAIIALLLGLLLPAIQSAREASRRSTCSNHLRQQVIATQNYESQHRVLPPGAIVVPQEVRPGLCWRVVILSHMEDAALYQKLDVQPNGTVANRVAARYVPAVFQCPSGRNNEKYSDYPLSNYDAVSGAGSNAAEIRDLDDQFCGDIYLDGIYYPGSRTRFKHITDGTSHTVALGERKYDLYTWLDGVNWYSAPDVEMCAYATKNMRYPLNADAAEFGYSVSDTDAPAGAVKNIVRNDLFFGSAHPGGALFAFADGSVDFIRDEIDFLIYKGMATKAGQEIVSLQ